MLRGCHWPAHIIRPVRRVVCRNPLVAALVTSWRLPEARPSGHPELPFERLELPSPRPELPFPRLVLPSQRLAEPSSLGPPFLAVSAGWSRLFPSASRIRAGASRSAHPLPTMRTFSSPFPPSQSSPFIAAGRGSPAYSPAWLAILLFAHPHFPQFGIFVEHSESLEQAKHKPVRAVHETSPPQVFI